MIAANNFGERDLSTALSSRNERIDGDTETFVVAHALRSEGADASEDGTGRGTPVVCATLNSGGNNGGFRSEPGEHLVADCLTQNYGKQPDSSNRNAGPVNLIAFDERNITSRENRSNPQPGDPCHTLHAPHTAAVAFTERTRAEGRNFESQEELAYAVTNPGSGGRTHSRQVAGGFGVRRLTPRECERLQGFPDDWTLYDAEGKTISDSARYRMLGNAVAVPVARWIGQRLMRFA